MWFSVLKLFLFSINHFSYYLLEIIKKYDVKSLVIATIEWEWMEQLCFTNYRTEWQHFIFLGRGTASRQQLVVAIEEWAWTMAPQDVVWSCAVWPTIGRRSVWLILRSRFRWEHWKAHSSECGAHMGCGCFLAVRYNIEVIELNGCGDISANYFSAAEGPNHCLSH